MVFLDEPTTGLDPRSRRTMWETIGSLTRAGVTVFLTTQYLEEADRLADHVAVLDGGRVRAEGTPEELKKTVAAQRLDLTMTGRSAYAELAGQLGERALHRAPEELVLGVATDGSAAHVRALLDELDPTRAQVAHFSLHSATLDDVFLELTHE